MCNLVYKYVYCNYIHTHTHLIFLVNNNTVKIDTIKLLDKNIIIATDPQTNASMLYPIMIPHSYSTVKFSQQ